MRMKNFTDSFPVFLTSYFAFENITGVKWWKHHQLGGFQSGQMGRTVNPLSYDFSGSNPLLPTQSAEALAKADSFSISQIANLIMCECDVRNEFFV